MRKPLILAIVFVLVCCFLPQEGNADIFLLSPADESSHDTPPTFSWTPGQFNIHMFISVFYYDVPGFTGYVPFQFFTIGTSLPMSAPWWNAIGEGEPCYWAEYELNDQGGFLSDIYWFMKGQP